MTVRGMTHISIQPQLLERWKTILPADALAAALDATPNDAAASIRLNPLRAPPAQTLVELQSSGIEVHPVTWCSHAFTTNMSARALQAHPAHSEGGFHIQSLSSIAASLALDPQPGESVLDLCAAPGSKTSHLAAMMNNRGQLVALDSSRSRLYRLREVLRILGATAECICAHGERWARGHPTMFDRVLVDAPCSGEGRIHLGDSAANDGWTISKVRRLASLQKSLLHSGIDALRIGGTLVYSTCTFAPEENEQVLQRALDRYEGRIEILPLQFDIPGSIPALTTWSNHALHPSIANARRILPPLEGFFIARIRKINAPTT